MHLPDPRYLVTDKNHRYTIELPNGERVGPLKSVTGVIGIIDKPALKGWAAREAAKFFKTEILRLGSRALDVAMLEGIANDAAKAHMRIAKDAADLGTACHNIFEAIIQGREPDVIPAELAEPAKDFKRWRLSTDIEIVAVEPAVASVEHRFGGRIDAVGYSKERGGFGIVDYKTSSGFYGNEYAYQVGGYAIALEEQFAIPVTWAEVIRFGKKPPYDSEGRAVVDMDAARLGFKTALALGRVNETPLLGPPTFSTAQVRAEEVAKTAAPGKRSTVDKALGF